MNAHVWTFEAGTEHGRLGRPGREPGLEPGVTLPEREWGLSAGQVAAVVAVILVVSEVIGFFGFGGSTGGSDSSDWEGPG